MSRVSRIFGRSTSFDDCPSKTVVFESTPHPQSLILTVTATLDCPKSLLAVDATAASFDSVIGDVTIGKEQSMQALRELANVIMCDR